MPKDIGHLEASLKELMKLLDGLANDDAISEVLRHIHQPGWTTPAEFLLVSELVSAMRAQAEMMSNLQGALVQGSRAIVTAGAVAVEA